MRSVLLNIMLQINENYSKYKDKDVIVLLKMLDLQLDVAVVLLKERL